MQNKAYKFRLNPNKEQQKLINKTFGCTRFTLNRTLGDALLRITKETKKSKINISASIQIKVAYKNFFNVRKWKNNAASLLRTSSKLL
ncbi:MAG: helix-turn-helix domain-containing protein [Clostridia bacterium]